MKKYSKLLVTISVFFVMLFVVGCDQLLDPGTKSNTYTVTFEANNDTEAEEVAVNSGKTVTRPDNPVKVDYSEEDLKETNYIFIGWYVDSELKKRFDFSTAITDNITLYAKWQQIASKGIAKNSSEIYAKTEEVCVIAPDKIGDSITTVAGSLPTFLDESADIMDLGVFWLGREVQISPFVIGRYEVTQELYEAVMANNTIGLTANPSECTGSTYTLPNVDGDKEQKYRPVENITWYDAVYFCNKLSEMVGLEEVYTITNITVESEHITAATVTSDISKNGYRLPTEPEWEFAARGGNPDTDIWNFVFSGADTVNNRKYNSKFNSGLDTIGWYAFNTCNEGGITDNVIPNENRKSWGTHETGSRAYNEFGLYDMSGNVSEWCFDIPVHKVEKDPEGAGSGGTDRAVRGGSWFKYASKCVVTNREEYAPTVRSKDIGLRIVRSVRN